MALHLKNNTRLAEEVGQVPRVKDEVAGMELIVPFIQAERDCPMSGANPLSYWSNSFIKVSPTLPGVPGGNLLELVIRNCDLVCDLSELAPALASLKTLEWLDLSENPGLQGDVGSLAAAPLPGSTLTGCLKGLDLHEVCYD